MTQSGALRALRFPTSGLPQSLPTLTHWAAFSAKRGGAIILMPSSGPIRHASPLEAPPSRLAPGKRTL